MPSISPNHSRRASPFIARKLDFFVNDGRYADDKLYTGEGIATFRTRQILPVIWKAGAKWKREVRDFQNRRSA
ncbi:MAG: hypothetical protein RL077_922, partial [Verrucomicrobiota bacterium]